MTLNLQEVARAVGASAVPESRSVGGWSVDTRTQNSGDVYFALRGGRTYAYNFPAAKSMRDVNAEKAIERSTA